MCGIVGIVGRHADTGAGAAWLDQALQAIGVRGPDAVGRWHAPGVRLGHRRLSIRDLSPTGAQPMHSASGDTVVVYNGEIYATDTLAGPLRAEGWTPRGHSDTEILLEHAERAGLPSGPLRAQGQAALGDLIGMFGLAFWHGPTGRLTLARDRIGIKPLYVAELYDGLAFCSEPAPLASAPGRSRLLDPEALALFLCLGMIPSPWSLSRGTRQLRPGEVLQWTADQGVQRGSFGTMPLPAAPGYAPSDPVDEAALEALLLQVVKDQLVSDVPVGVLLSGGVDSSVVAAAAARAGGTLQTFSVVHPDPDYDERLSARAVAKHLGTEHHELELHPGGMTEDELTELVTRTGDPFADSSALPMRRLSGRIREHVTVALSGDGGDELFAGYPRYTLADRMRVLERVPRRLRRVLVQGWSRLDRVLPSGRRRDLARQVARAAHLSLRPGGEQAVGTVAYMWPDEVRPLLQPGLRTSITLGDLVEDRLGRPPAMPDAWFLHALEQRLVLPDIMLVKVDRTSMGASLEVRPPLLDDRIVAAAARVPFDRKVRNGEGKAILKSIARRWVPPEVIDRPKKGFAVPLIAYGGQVMDDAGRWALQGSDSPLRQIFTADALRQLSTELERPPAGRSPEDSAFRLAHRRWLLILLARAMVHQGLEVPT